jgi:hypothetical protein
MFDNTSAAEEYLEGIKVVPHMETGCRKLKHKYYEMCKIMESYFSNASGNKPELLPCPMCANEVIDVVPKEGGSVVISCKVCGLNKPVPMYSKELCEAFWNERRLNND